MMTDKIILLPSKLLLFYPFSIVFTLNIPVILSLVSIRLTTLVTQTSPVTVFHLLDLCQHLDLFPYSITIRTNISEVFWIQFLGFFGAANQTVC